ncbi:malonate decarboxylase acyl carrier protein [Azonexus sp. R2A61]|uniref:malonate decarboxylase acyl carrier protein n=1 Tax=Azonexus sp. R2A61 TaxID=2744443 RepID=UPI001F3AB7BA|nr:malonate decarboxylase acyl carrier protein [Azonexus sp. R2A61]
MEILTFEYPSAPLALAGQPALCGVVGSGNLEILIRAGERPDYCRIRIHTSARGFGEIWQAVIGEFAAGNAAGGTEIAINDMGATPAIVSLRLVQTLAEYAGERQ